MFMLNGQKKEAYDRGEKCIYIGHGKESHSYNSIKSVVK